MLWYDNYVRFIRPSERVDMALGCFCFQPTNCLTVFLLCRTQMHVPTSKKSLSVICLRNQCEYETLVCLSVCLPFCLSIYLPIYLSICLPAYLSVCLSICLLVY